MISTARFTCPVCGWPDLADDPLLETFEICPCCATEFGNDDLGRTHDDLREQWIHRGMHFWQQEREPADWNPVAQLRAAGLPTDAS